MIDVYIADGGEPLWVICVWLVLKFLVVWLALRLPALRALLATVGMVMASTVILLGAEIILPTSLPLLPLLVLGVAVETAVESAVVVWVFRGVWSRRFALLFVANAVALTVSIVAGASRDIDRAVRAQSVPIGTSRDELLQIAPGPDVERSVDESRDLCPPGTVRALEYHVPTGVMAMFFPLEHRLGSSVTTICLDAMDRVVDTEVFVD